MATQGVQLSKERQLEPAFLKFMSYLNPAVKPSTKQHFQFSRLNDDSILMLKMFLPSTNRESVSLQVDELPEQIALDVFFIAFNNERIKSKNLTLGKHILAFERPLPLEGESVILDRLNVEDESKLVVHLKSITADHAEQLAKILKSALFKKIEIKIDSIPNETTLSILRAIGGNLHVQQINIKIPDYYVDNLQALRAFLTKPPSEQLPRQVVAAVEQTEDMAEAIARDLAELKLSTEQSFNGAVERGRTFFTSFVRPTISSFAAFLTEEEPAPAAALEQRTEEARRSSSNPM